MTLLELFVDIFVDVLSDILFTLSDCEDTLELCDIPVFLLAGFEFELVLVFVVYDELLVTTSDVSLLYLALEWLPTTYNYG